MIILKILVVIAFMSAFVFMGATLQWRLGFPWKNINALLDKIKKWRDK